MTNPAPVEPTPLYDQTTAALADPSPAVDNAGDSGTPATPSDPTDAPAADPAAPAALDLPAGPNLDDLQTFTDDIPDEGHRAIAQKLVDAFTIRDAQLTAFIGAYTTATGQIAELAAALGAEKQRATAAEQVLTDTVTALQAAVAALQPPPAPTTTTTDPAPPTTT